jgi:hypothetical protein
MPSRQRQAAAHQPLPTSRRLCRALLARAASARSAPTNPASSATTRAARLARIQTQHCNSASAACSWPQLVSKSTGLRSRAFSFPIEFLHSRGSHFGLRPSFPSLTVSVADTIHVTFFVNISSQVLFWNPHPQSKCLESILYNEQSATGLASNMLSYPV